MSLARRRARLVLGVVITRRCASGATGESRCAGSGGAQGSEHGGSPAAVTRSGRAGSSRCTRREAGRRCRAELVSAASGCSRGAAGAESQGQCRSARRSGRSLGDRRDRERCAGRCADLHLRRAGSRGAPAIASDPLLSPAGEGGVRSRAARPSLISARALRHASPPVSPVTHADTSGRSRPQPPCPSRGRISFRLPPPLPDLFREGPAARARSRSPTRQRTLALLL